MRSTTTLFGCRALDRVVADDPYTFTIGNRLASWLIFLRLKTKEEDDAIDAAEEGNAR